LDRRSVSDRPGEDDAPSARLALIEAGGFSAQVDAYAWELDEAARVMRLWFVSLLGPQQSVKALWARLLKGEQATMRFEDLGTARFCGLAPEGPKGWRFFTASLPAAAGYHGVLIPEVALFSADRTDFLLLARDTSEAPRLHYRFLDRRLDLPLSPAWDGWLWERGLCTGEIRPLEGAGLSAFRCTPDRNALASDLSAGVSGGVLTLLEAARGAPSPVELAAAAA
jgi:hypothetical protein